MLSSKGSPQPRGRTHVSYISCIAGRFFTISASWEGSIDMIAGSKTESAQKAMNTREMLLFKFCSMDYVIAKKTVAG